MNQTTTAKVRWGIFGGTFDPIHIGHLILAEDALRAAGLAKVLFVPAFFAPLRTSANTASAEDRLRMLELALAPFPYFSVCEYEISLKRQVYSLDTVSYLQTKHPDVDFSFLIGEDQSYKLPQWYKIEDLARMVTFLCARRSSKEERPAPKIPLLQLEYFSSRRVDISATEIRKLLAENLPAGSLLPESVAEYIQKKQPYA